jgi:hypothetical protein
MARRTLERGMIWARRAFDELILPATSVSFLVKDYLLDPVVFSGYASHLVLVGGRPLSLQIGDVPARCANSVRSGLSWRRSSSWPGWQWLVPWRARLPREHPLKLPASRRKIEPSPQRPLPQRPPLSGTRWCRGSLLPRLRSRGSAQP